MIRQINNLFSVSSLRTELSGSIKFIGLPKHFHRTLPQIFIFLFLLIFLSFNCNTNEPPKDNGAITLSVEDASCIEAWINLKVENITLPAAVTLKQSENNGEEKVRQVINLTTADTLLYVDSLLPKRSYKFKAEWINNTGKLKTAEAATVTMDTTSHNFTWQTFTFGQHSSSVLYDVAIINENNIWAVGEIYMNDSLGNPDPHAYNAVHWDGSEWKVKRIYTYSSCNAVDYAPLKAICFFSDTNIVVTSGGSIGWFNGTNNKPDCSIRPLLTGSINKLWGSSSNDLYAVGNGGNIAHWDGISWKKIESGTDVNLKDIYGTPDGKNVWISGYQDFKPTVLLKISNSIIETAFNTRDYLYVNSPDHLSGGIESVWTNNNNFVYLTTWYGLYRKSIYIDPSREEYLPPSGRGRPSSLDWRGIRSRATDINNIFTSGYRGTVHHFNGVTYSTYSELADNGVTYYSLDVEGNLSVLCGQKFENGINDKAIITLTN